MFARLGLRSAGAIVATAVLAALIGPQAAWAAGGAPATSDAKLATALCAEVGAWMPHHAHTGDAVDVDGGLENCGTAHRRFRFVFSLKGPCHTGWGYTKRYQLPPGYGFGFSALMAVPCAGTYRLRIRAFHGAHLMDRKVRRMVVTDPIGGTEGAR
jgi:hypothetical protein